MCSQLTLPCLQQALGQTDPLLITHRLDACTEGIHVLAKTREFAGHFNGLIRLPGSIRKWYRALSAHPPPVGGSAPPVLSSVANRDVASSSQCCRFHSVWLAMTTYCCAGELTHHLLINQRSVGQTQHTVVLDHAVPGSLESILEVLQVCACNGCASEQSAFCGQPLTSSHYSCR